MDSRHVRAIFFILLSVVVCHSCRTKIPASTSHEYLRWVGDIQHDSLLDDPAFRVCGGDEKVYQYFNPGDGPLYPGEKSAILKKFDSEYMPVADADESGYLRIRFIVNCEGRAGRFRVLQSNTEYREIEMDQRIVSQILAITKGIQSWEVMYKEGEAIDYYFYMIFKIKDGAIDEILP